MAQANITHTLRGLARELVAPFTVYLDGQALAEFKTDDESDAYFQRLRAELGKGKLATVGKEVVG